MKPKSLKTGVIDRRRIYTAAALNGVGIGGETLRQARQEGVVPVMVSKRYWYDGNQIADWMLSQMKQTK